VRQAHQALRERRHIVQAVALQEHLVVTFGKPVTTRVGLRVRIFDVEDAADGLLLEPLPRVALVDACSISKLGSRQRTTVCERR
jgi:hypothetical protein